MANFRSIYKIQVFLTILVHLTLALYEDQVGKFDWKSSFVGKVRHVSLEAKRIIVATEENVLASLNLKSGDIQWKQILESPGEGQRVELLQVNKDILTVSGTQNNWLVRTWDLNTGSLLTEWSLNNEKLGPAIFKVSNNQLYQLVLSETGGFLDILTYSIEFKRKLDQSSVETPWLKDLQRCVVTEATYFACPNNNGVYFTDLSGDLKFRYEPLVIDVLGLIPFGSESVLAVQSSSKAKLVHLGPKFQIKPFDLMPNAFSVVDSKLIYQLEMNNNNKLEKLIKVATMSLETGKVVSQVDIDYPIGLGAPIILAAESRDAGTHLLLSTTDEALLMLEMPQGKVLWTREESLSNIVSEEFVELPISELDASIEHEFDNHDFFQRISVQLKQFYNLIFGNSLLKRSGLIRDTFGLHKLIVLATRAGKLFAIDTLSGGIAWSYRLPQVGPYLGLDNEEQMLLFTLRGAQHAPLEARCVLVARDLISGNGVLFEFNPITGYSEKGILRLNFPIVQALMLSKDFKDHLKPFLLVDNKKRPHLYPEGSILNLGNVYLYLADHKNSNLEGFKLAYEGDRPVLTSLWQIKMEPSKIVDIKSKLASERVLSQGKVLYDRSVYYKYVNPNLIAVATLSSDPVNHNVVSIHLIDGITGLIMHSVSHKRARGPIHMVHSENWLVYTYFNERFRRVEVTALELYEGHLQSNKTVFSSFAVSQLPIVQSQSYILPGTPLKIEVTQTLHGITNKFLLVALSNGAVVEIPWLLLQPRFSNMPCGPEESCIPYMPEIPLPPEAIINYNQSLNRVRGVKVSPARLESTSHVLVHGLDIFYTRVAPSKTFDVLKEDFDYRLIILVLLGLIGASFITKHLAARKALKQAWK